MQTWKRVWQALRAWPIWKKLLYPHPLLVILLSILSGAGLVWVFLNGLDQSLAAYLLYPVSAYALVVLIALVIRLVPWVKKKQAADPVYQKLEKMESDGAFGIGMYREQLVNFCYGGFKIWAGITTGSGWIGADGIYNFTQGCIQLYQILRHRSTTEIRKQWKVYRNCGYLMLLVNVTMSGLLYQMINMGRHEENSEIAIIATAAFTFYKLTKALIEVARDRKHKNPVDSAVYFLDLGQALYNLFVLQVGLLWVYGAEYPDRNLFLNNLTGTVVCLLVCGMGIYMPWRANRDLKKLEAQ